MMISKTLSDYLEYLKYEKKYSEHTVKGYERDIRGFVQYLKENYEEERVAQVKHSYMRTWLVGLMQDKVSATTVKRKVSSLKSFFRYCQKVGLIEINPMDKIVAPKGGRKVPNYIPINELNAIVDAITTDEGDLQSVQRKVIFLMLLHTGIRRAELINLRVADVDLTSKTLKVMGKGGKARIVPFMEELQSELQRFLELRNRQYDAGYLFLTKSGKKLYPKYVYKVVSDLLSPLNNVAKKGPHILRHSYATGLLNGGADINAIKELLGHSNLNATQIYTQNSIENLKNIHKLTHPKSRS